ncbi:trimeric intracellular cation channel family protein [uncultured Jannaschia sp.]|uniref:trimeric intracellular cation channel family protein n=1 Tax=uncultured Jannaschia sp. TaxID=293347 RepID=UPI002613E897|nr:trimeric intracellular cation channel family protein [uncultured Jannaschia sp.]
MASGKEFFLTFDVFMSLLDWFGVVVFAITGALVASRKEMDLTGFALLGTVTGIGGGTIRDLLLGIRPIFWVEDPRYVLFCVAVSALVFLTTPAITARRRLLLWFDAVGLALFAVTGAERALEAGTGAVVAVLMGMITATFGGIIRDVLGNESPAILSREVYATAALVGAAAFAMLMAVGVDREAAVIASVLAGFLVRSAALIFGWSLPRYRPRPGRPDGEP